MINGHLVHSKLKSHEWPKPKVLFQQIQEGLEKLKVAGNDISKVEEEEEGCVIM